MSALRRALGVAALLVGVATAQDAATSVHGRVLDEALRPIAGASLGVVHPDAEGGDATGPAVTSGADGAFAVELAAEPGAGDRLVVAARGFARYEFTLVPRSLDDLVLPRGVSILGSVRDPEGRPLEGVAVTATDALAETGPLRALLPTGVGRAVTTAASDARGLFRLDGALPTAVALRLQKNGYAPRVVMPFSLGEPLAVEMRPTGVVRGRIFDADARPVAAQITLRHVDDGASQHVRAGSDGAFEIGLERDAPFELSAVASVDGVDARLQRGPFDGPRDKLVLTFERPAARDVAAEQPSLLVAAFDNGSGAPIEDFRAAAVWQATSANFGPDLLWRLVREQMVAATDGVVRVPGPPADQSQNGTVVVFAPGRGFGRLDGANPTAVATDGPLRVGLDPSASLRGRVVDPVGGTGVPDVRVGWVGFGQAYWNGSNSERLRTALLETKTDAAGRFVLDGLTSGRVEIAVVCDGRPDPSPQLVDVDAAAVAEIRIDAPRAARVHGVLRGLADAAAVRVLARPISVVPGVRMPGGVPQAERVGDDGAFAIGGLGPGYYALELALPRLPRGGDVPRIVLDTFRIRPGVDRECDVDVADDLLETRELRLHVVGAALPRERLVVVAENEAIRPFATPYQASGVSGVAGSDGRVQLRMPRARHRIRVFDVATGIELLRRDGYLVEAGDTAPLELEVATAALDVTIRTERPGDAARLLRIGVALEWPQPGRLGSTSGATSDFGIGVTLEPGQREALLYVPPRPLTMRVWARGAAADEDAKTKRQSAAVERELTPEAGARVPVELVVPPLDGDR